MRTKVLSIVVIFTFFLMNVNAQTTSSSYFLKANKRPDCTLLYNLADSGVAKPMLFGLDTSWPSETNMRRGVAFMGAGNIDIVRVSFQPSHPIVDGDLQWQQIADLKTRLQYADIAGKNVKVELNDDTHDGDSVDSWYGSNAERWAQLIDITTKRLQESGHPVISVAPFNEPDYTDWNQGSKTDFYNITAQLKKNSRFDTIRICGGNTLNTDEALSWYNALKSNLDEGNTHQLAGSFANYATFFQTVRANGDYATADELHNTMEAMVGVEYGAQEGIWWGTAEYSRSAFCKASKGKRLGYAEHRDNWTAASVYRNTDSQVQACRGASERQAVTTTFRFAYKDRDVYYDGYGPTREYLKTIPGGTGYQTGQSNAECVVNITSGDDVQPVIKGKYYIVNRATGKALAQDVNNTSLSAAVRQYDINSSVAQQWNVVPVDSTIGGDYSYFLITSAKNGYSFDIINWSLSEKTGLTVYTLAKGANQQWFLEYADDGYFYIRNRQSSKCLQPMFNSAVNGVTIAQYTKSNIALQQWRFVPADVSVDFKAPAAPTSLSASANNESVSLSWTPSTATDVRGYDVLRAEFADGEYNTIARYVTTSSYVDNTVTANTTYYYKVRAQDLSLNRSDCSNVVSAASTGANNLVADYDFENSDKDNTINQNDCDIYGTPTYATGKIGNRALSFDGSTYFVQLPYTIANHQSMTIAAWVYWKGGDNWQRIFDFGNGETQYMFLSPSTNDSKLKFAIKNEGTEWQLNTSSLAKNTWTHIAVTIGATDVCMYVNGALVSQTKTINVRPTDFKPLFNYIGRSQFSDPLFNGYIDEFRIYNYDMSATDVATLANSTVNGIEPVENTQWTDMSVYDVSGKLLKNCRYDSDVINSLSSGTYILKLSKDGGATTKVITKP